MLNFGILWINARNLSYIKKFNNKKDIRLANEKIETKNFLSVRWIPFAKTYAIIKDRKQLFAMDFSSLPNKEFVIKPNKWSKGKWIYITKFLGKTEYNKNNDKSKNILQKIKDKFDKIEQKVQKLPNLPHFYSISGKLIDDNTFRRYILDNLDGKNSITGWWDKVIVEEKLFPSKSFKKFCKYGLADIRIIVFNLVPVWAMVRMPSKKSEWKANLAAWWVGFGIEVWTWTIESMFQNKKIYKWKFTEEFKSFKTTKIPYWDDILLLSSKIQYFVNLWYLALDRVITDEWPKLLEINARAWLEVQNISGIKLWNILNKISDLKISDPEKWVEIAKTLFSKKVSKIQSEKILYLSQNGNIGIEWEDAVVYEDLLIKVNINKSENYISKDLFELIKGKSTSTIHLELPDNDIILKNIKFLMDETLSENEIILWKATSSQFLIKPLEKASKNTQILSNKDIEIEQKNKLHKIDNEISKIWKKLILNKILKPINYLEELDKFIWHRWKYNPKFKYKFPDDKEIKDIQKMLLEIQKELNKNTYDKKLWNLFLEKIQDLLFRTNLIKAYKTKNYKNILLYNEKLFGKINNNLLKLSKSKIFEWEPEDRSLLWKTLDIGEVKSAIEKHLNKIGIVWVDTIITSTSLSRISVLMWKNVRIKINRLFPFQELELDSILAHEIDTHLIRYINWSKSGRKIFKEWVGFHIIDEEWLAIYNANKKVPNTYEKLSIYKRYFLLKEAQKYSFSKLVDLVKFLYPEKKIETVFNTILRLKKGIIDTSVVNEWAIFMKEKVYLDGYEKIKKYTEGGGELDKMYKWKLKLENLDLII